MARDPDTIGVLLVEDQMGMRKIIKTVLQAIGVKSIFEAADGMEALGILRNPTQVRSTDTGIAKHQPLRFGRPTIDFIICDWAMPRMTGIELLEAVRKDDKYGQVPFIMLTAENTREQIVTAVELGVTDYIIKPFTATVLEAKLRSLLLGL